MPSTQQIPGIASGFDTASIVEQLMKIEKIPYEKLDVKKQTAELKRQAYQAVSTMLMKFKSSVSNLASQSLWKAKSATSTNESSLTATANQYAVNGTYAFRVAQLATAAQFMTKGFANTKTAFVKQAVGSEPYKLGEITLNNAKARIDTSAKLEDLNGGRGVFRGAIRVTDGANHTATIDLSACSTMDDVVRKINEASGVQIEASIVDGKLVIADESGGGGKLKIQNSGTGTTATDLGIAGTASAAGGSITGRNVYYLGTDTGLAMLNDGLGVEEGYMKFTVTGDARSYDFLIDVTDVSTVGDIINRVNNEMAARIADLKRDPAKAAENHVLNADLLEGLKFGMNADGNAFALTGTKAGYTYTFENRDNTNLQGQSTPASQLGLAGKTHAVTQDNEVVSFSRLIGTVDSPMLKSLSGVNGSGVGGNSTAFPEEVDLTENTLLSNLRHWDVANQTWKGFDVSTGFQIDFREGGTGTTGGGLKDGVVFDDILDGAKLNELINNKDTTVKQLLDFVNQSIADYANDPTKNAAGLKGLEVKLVYDSGDPDAPMAFGIGGGSAAHLYQIGGSVASSLGITRAYQYALSNPNTTDEQKAYKTAVEAFYSSSQVTKPNLSFDFSATGPKAGVAYTLDDLENFDPDTFNGKTISLKVGSNTINVSFAAGTFSGTTTVKDFMDTFNTAIRDAVETDFGPNSGINPPQLAVNQYANGFRWSNIDMEETFDVVGYDTWTSALGVTKSWDPSGANVDDLYDAFAAKTSTLTDNNVIDLTATAPAAGVAYTLGDLKDFNLDAFNGKTVTFKVDGVDYPVTFATGTFDANTTVKDFLDTVNQAMTTAGLAVQLKVNAQGTGFQWDNVDKTKTFSVDSSFAGAIGVAADWDPTKTSFGSYDRKIPLYYINEPFTWVTAVEQYYYEPIEVNKDTAIGYLNGGKGLKLSPPDATVDFDFGNDRKISITMQEIRDAINNDPATTLEQYAAKLTELVNAKIAAQTGDKWKDTSLTFAVDGDQLYLKDLKGMTSLTVNGKDGAVSTGSVGFGWVDMKKVDANTKIQLGHLKAGKLAEYKANGLGSVNLTVNGTTYSLSTAALTDGQGNIIEPELTQDSTLKDLINRLNREAARQGLSDITFTYNDAGTGIAVENSSGSKVTFLSDPQGGMLAEDLGLVDKEGKGMEVDAYGFRNSTSLGRRYISRSTNLDSLYTGGEKVALGSLKITDARGSTYNIDIAECKTVGDLVDAINSVKPLGVKAFLNEHGDGITLYELYESGYEPTSAATGNISVTDGDGGNIAKLMGFSGEGVIDPELGVHVLKASQRSTIDVMSTDTLETLMYRISEKGYKTAIINDGTSTSPYRLTISSATTGEASDFTIESDLEMFGFNQTARGKDSKVLYGDPDSGASPVMLSSATNSNSSAILGLTLNFKATSETYSTITVDTDKTKVTEEIKNMVQMYNDMNDLVSYLDAYDPETGEPGILFGDTSVRSLMSEINDMFYMVFNPDNLAYNDIVKKGNATGQQQTWTWMDLGVSLTAKNTNSDPTKGTWYSSMDLDLDKLESMVSANWDTLYNMMAGQRNASNSKLADTVRATATFNGTAAEGYKADNAINGDSNKSSWGVNSGFMAENTIKSGANEYTIYFQKPTTMSRMSIYHQDSSTALKDFTVEYLNADTGKWETLREIKNNGVDANHLGMVQPTNVSAVRIKATSTNASDDKFRLLDVQIFEDTGLAGKLNQTMTALGDSSTGWMANRTSDLNADIADITNQMDKLQERLNSKEEALWRQFTAMETAMSQLQGQGNYFSSMMSSLNTKK